MNVARIPSRVYFELFQTATSNFVDPDKVIACYSIIKTSREKEKYLAYTAKNNKFVGGYALLRKETNLSLNSLKKYVPSIIDAGLICFEDNGDVSVLGNNKLKTQYENEKLVPIQILGTLSKTAKSSFNVRLHSAKKQQEALIKKKRHQRELLMQVSNPTNYKKYKEAQRFVRKNGTKDIQLIDKVVLSNEGYCKLKFGEANNKSKGHYWKSTMKELGFIKTKRNFKKIKKMSFGEYKLFKSQCDDLIRNRFTYFRGHLVEEQISEIMPQEKSKSIKAKRGFEKKVWGSQNLPTKDNNPFHPNDPLHTWVKEDLYANKDGIVPDNKLPY